MTMGGSKTSVVIAGNVSEHVIEIQSLNSPKFTLRAARPASKEINAYMHSLTIKAVRYA